MELHWEDIPFFHFLNIGYVITHASRIYKLSNRTPLMCKTPPWAAERGTGLDFADAFLFSSAPGPWRYLRLFFTLALVLLTFCCSVLTPVGVSRCLVPSVSVSSCFASLMRPLSRPDREEVCIMWWYASGTRVNKRKVGRVLWALGDGWTPHRATQGTRNVLLISCVSLACFLCGLWYYYFFVRYFYHCWCVVE